MKKFLLVCAMAFGVSGCSGAFKATYAAGVTAKDLITGAQAEYSTQLMQRVSECDPVQNPEKQYTSIKQFDDCLGPMFSEATQIKIVKALGGYNLAASTLSAVLLGCQPNADGTPVKAATCIKRVATSKELRDSRIKLINASRELLELFPNASQHLKSLKGL